jgi:iron complex transport system ATP-binding protein
MVREVPVRLEAVSASYDKPHGQPLRSGWQLERVDLTIERGELVAVLGPNGSGKTTLVRLVAGILAPTEGKVELLGQDARSLDRNEIAKLVAVVPQRNEVALGFSVREVVAMGRAPHQGAWQRIRPQDGEIVERVLRSCELVDLGHRPVASLSGGEQKRAHIARALAQEAPILLLDEAAAHLDIRHAMALHELVRAEVRARRLACLCVMHDLDAAARYADRIVLLKDGKKLADGPIAEVMTAKRLGQAFGAEIHVGTSAPEGRRYFLPISPLPPGEG